MRNKAGNAGYYRAQSELRAHLALKRGHVPQAPGERYRHERHEVVERELRGVEQPGVLNGLQKAVNEACDKSPAAAEHIAVEHEGQHGGKGYRAAHGHVQYPYVRERERERHAHRGKGDGARVEALYPVGQHGNYNYGGGKYYGARIQPRLVAAGKFNAVPLAGVARRVVNYKAHNGRHKRAAAYGERGNFYRLYGLERHGNGARYRNYRKHEQGIECDGHKVVLACVYVAVIKGAERYYRRHHIGKGNKQKYSVCKFLPAVFYLLAGCGLGSGEFYCNSSHNKGQRKRYGYPQHHRAAAVGRRSKVGEIVFNVAEQVAESQHRKIHKNSSFKLPP